MAKYRFAALFVNLGLVAAMLLGAPCAAQADIAIQDAEAFGATTAVEKLRECPDGRALLSFWRAA